MCECGWCTGCSIAGATVSSSAGGTCACGNGYAPHSPATIACAIPEATLNSKFEGTCACAAPKYKDKTSPTTLCESLCDQSCSTCTNPTSGGCLTCKVASLTKADGGVCYSGTGYVQEFNSTVSCGACAPNDCVCSGLKSTACLKPEHQVFVAFATGYNLYLASPVNGAWCFGSPMPASARKSSEVETVIGPIT